MVSLPAGVHRVTRRNGRVAYYWRPGRGTPWVSEVRSQWCRLPDNPNSSDFYDAIKQAKSPHRGEIDRIVSEYLESPQYNKLSASTQKVYKLYMNGFADCFYSHSLRDIQPHDIAKFQDKMSAKPSAADMAVTCIKILYVWAIRKGYATTNPAREIKKQHSKVKPHEPWPQSVLDLIPSMPDVQMIACMLALYTGQRMGDVVNMQLGHIKNSRIHVVQEKTGIELDIPVHRDLWPVIEKCKKRGSIYMVSKENGQPYSKVAFKGMWYRLLRDEPFDTIKKEGLVFHGLRKSAVVRLLEAGCTAAETGAITGQTLQTVNHYAAGVNQRKLADAAIAKQEQM